MREALGDLGDVIVEIDSEAKNEAATKPAGAVLPRHKLLVYLLSRIDTSPLYCNGSEYLECLSCYRFGRCIM